MQKSPNIQSRGFRGNFRWIIRAACQHVLVDVDPRPAEDKAWQSGGRLGMQLELSFGGWMILGLWGRWRLSGTFTVGARGEIHLVVMIQDFERQRGKKTSHF